MFYQDTFFRFIQNLLPKQAGGNATVIDIRLNAHFVDAEIKVLRVLQNSV